MLDLKQINEQLGSDTVVFIYSIQLLPTYLIKMQDIWQNVVIPEQKPDDTINYVIAYTTFSIGDINKNLFWVFTDNDIDVVSEINQILLENKDEA